MPSVSTSGATISYDVHGAVDAPALLFLNSIGSTRALWDRQRRAFEGAYRVICYDARGHGRSSVPPGPYSIAQLAGDALAILDAESIAAAHLCGLSLGGLTALWMALHAPDRVRSLLLANTGARIGSVEFWDARMALVRERGMAAVADIAIPNWFTEAFRAREPETVQRIRDDINATSAEGYVACCAAMRDEDLRGSLPRLQCPLLAIAGAFDRSTAPDLLQFVHEQVAGSQLVTLDAAHLSNIEQESAFNVALRAFLTAHA
jgi:3-oxoadipate enol-lactonase